MTSSNSSLLKNRPIGGEPGSMDGVKEMRCLEPKSTGVPQPLLLYGEPVDGCHMNRKGIALCDIQFHPGCF